MFYKFDPITISLLIIAGLIIIAVIGQLSLWWYAKTGGRNHDGE